MTACAFGDIRTRQLIKHIFVSNFFHSRLGKMENAFCQSLMNHELFKGVWSWLLIKLFKFLFIKHWSWWALMRVWLSCDVMKRRVDFMSIWKQHFLASNLGNEFLSIMNLWRFCWLIYEYKVEFNIILNKYFEDELCQDRSRLFYRYILTQ